MLSVDSVTISFNGVDLFKNISFLINKRERLGLTGKNGAGKSTMLKLILGEISPNSGQISKPSDLTIGYLPQTMKVSDTMSIIDETLTAFEEVNNLEKEIEHLNKLIAERTDYESDEYNKLLVKLSEASDRFTILNGNNIQAEAEKTLKGIGFLPEDFDKPTASLSGGWRMRIELAKILLRKPQLLLLDEPTNHLDIEAIDWLEQFLKDYYGAVVLISHDRTFLDNITNRTIEISLGKIYDYKANYSKYLELRRERRIQQLNAYENQRKMIEKTEEFIERFRYKATKAVQVQSKIKQLEKIERIEVDDDDNAKIHFKFPPAPRSGDIVLETNELSKSYGDKLVLDNVKLIVERGEKIAFVGKNGEGKTTLAKIIVGELDYSGFFKLGHNVKIGYFAQNQVELLDQEKTVFQTLDDIAVGEVRKDLRSILGAFLFSGDDIDKKVKVLSGGEKTRLALSKLLLEPYNLLILDEPTNHLDIKSKEVLKQALLQYDGTLILVSHDRDFLNGLTETLYEFKNHKIKQFIGNVFEFLKIKRMEHLDDLNIAKKQLKKDKQEKVSNNKLSYEERKQKQRELRKLTKQVENIETEIEQIETEIKQLNDILAKPNDSIDFNEIYQKLEKQNKHLEEKTYEWEILIEQKEDLETEIKN